MHHQNTISVHAKGMLLVVRSLLACVILLAGVFIVQPSVSHVDAAPQGPANTWVPLGVGLNASVYDIKVVGADVYVAGNFTDAGGAPSGIDYLARWDTLTGSWYALGDGLEDSAYAIEVVGSDVYVGGAFDYAGSSVPNTYGIARWDANDSTWNSVCGGFNASPAYEVYDIEVVGSDIFVVGYFEIGTGDDMISTLARCDGTNWHALWTNTIGGVYELTAEGSDLYVGGTFTSIDGDTNKARIARYDISTSTWHSIGTGLNDSVWEIQVAGDRVYVGGNFSNAGGNNDADRIAYWDGSAWHALGTGANNRVNDILIVGSDVYVGGWFNLINTQAIYYIARWDGTNWHPLEGSLNALVRCLAIEGSQIYVGGDFTEAGGESNADHIAYYDITEDDPGWNPIGDGLNGTVDAMVSVGSNLYVGGRFTDAGGISAADYIARWDGSSWHALGTGVNDYVYAIKVVGSDVYVGGRFTAAGGVANTGCIARWDGSNWNALGSGISNGMVYTIDNQGGALYVGGNFTSAGSVSGADRIAFWSGAAWSALGNGLYQSVHDIEVVGKDVYMGGEFNGGSGYPTPRHIIRWDSSSDTWNALGGDNDLTGAVYALDVVGSRVYVGGSFTDAGSVADADRIAYYDYYDGSWNDLGTADQAGVIREVKVIGPNVLTGGYFSDLGGSANADHIGIWIDGGWNSVGGGLNDTTRSIIQVGTQIYAGGLFEDAGGHSTADHIAVLDVNPNPLPVITTLDPPSIIVGSGSFTLIVEGIGFLPTSVVRWDGVDRTTTYISATQLSINVPAEDVDTKGTVNLTVYNPAPGGGTSDVYALLIDDRHSYLPLINR